MSGTALGMGTRNIWIGASPYSPPDKASGTANGQVMTKCKEEILLTDQNVQCARELAARRRKMMMMLKLISEKYGIHTIAQRYKCCVHKRSRWSVCSKHWILSAELQYLASKANACK